MLALLAALALQVAAPPSDHVHKTTLQTQDYPGAGNHTVTVKTVVDPTHEVALHIHPGLEMAYIVSGAATVKMPDAPEVKLKAGDSIAIPPRIPHVMKNAGLGPLVILSTYVVDPAQPIAQVPAPPPAPPAAARPK